MKPTYAELYEFVRSLAEDEPRAVEPEVDALISRATEILTKEVDVYVIVEGGVVQSIRSPNVGLILRVIDLDDLSDAGDDADLLAQEHLKFARTLPAIW